MAPNNELELDLIVTEDGTVATWWWTPELGEIMETIGSPSPGMEEVNNFKFCG